MKIHELINIHSNKRLESNPIIDSLEYLDGEILIPRDVEDGIFNFLPLFKEETKEGSFFSFKQFHKVNLNKKIIGIDSSIIPIAESKNGFVLGLKGSVVVEFKKSYEVVVIGPIPIYISLENIRLFTERLGYPEAFIRKASLDIGYAKKLAVDIFETNILVRTLERYEDSIILIDGSLSKPFKYGRERFSYMFNIAKSHDNSLVGISKKSRLMKKYPLLYNIVLTYSVPGALKVPSFMVKRNSTFSIFISLFKASGLPFRVDIPTGIDSSHILNQIYSSSITPIGYPEVLKESHILSKFSHFEVLVLKRYLEFRGAHFVNTERLRDMIFGAFNKQMRVER